MLSVHAGTNSNACSCYHNYRGLLHRIPVMFNEVHQRIYFLCFSQPNHAHDAGMRYATQKHQLTKILVFSDKDTTLFIGKAEQGFISGLRIFTSGRSDVMSQVSRGLVQCS